MPQMEFTSVMDVLLKVADIDAMPKKVSCSCLREPVSGRDVEGYLTLCKCNGENLAIFDGKDEEKKPLKCYGSLTDKKFSTYLGSIKNKKEQKEKDKFLFDVADSFGSSFANKLKEEETPAGIEIIDLILIDLCKR